MRFVGIDPGATGAIALLSHTAERVRTWSIPTFSLATGGRSKTEVDLCGLMQIVEDVLTSYDDSTTVIIEHVSSSPQMGRSSAFNFGRSSMAVEAAFAFHNMVDEQRVIIQKVSPANWKRFMRLNADKDGARARATELWRKDASQFRLAKDHDRAEAALLAEYGRLSFQQREARSATGAR